MGFAEEEIGEIQPKTHEELSVDEKQQIPIAQLLMKEPNFAVLDEPTGTMDLVSDCPTIQNQKKKKGQHNFKSKKKEYFWS
ncbi:MAG: hypothetical protein WBE22_11055 [Halobacteriota archaeon]